MSAREREQTKFVHRERRMAIMIAAKAASSTEGANHDIMSVSEPEACLHGYGERRMAVMIAAKQRQAPKVRIMK